MLASISRIKPRRGSLENARAAFAAGDFLFSLDLLADDSAPESIILKTRALMRSGRVSDALELLDTDFSSDVSHEVAAEAYALKSYLLHALSRPDAALEAEARVRCFSAGIVAIEAELLFAHVIGAVLSDDYEAAETALREILELEEVRPSWLDSRSYRFTLNYWRARAFEMRGVIAHARGDHEVQARWLRRALEEFDVAEVRDDHIESIMLANFADAAIGTGSTEIVDFALERATRISWSPAIITHEFRVFSAIAETLSNLGDQVGALRYFRRCLACAPSVPLQIRASVERARLLSEIGESFSAREELDHALRLSKNVDWDNANPSEQRQLVFLAALVSAYSDIDAQRLMDRFDTISGRTTGLIALKDDRFRGDVFVVRALIARAKGLRDQAILLLIDALEVFVTAGYDAKAAAVAAELADLTNEPHYIAIARKQCAKHPLSILARKMARFESVDRSPQPVPTKRTLTLV